MASDAFLRAATDLVHVLGGLGYTWEHDAHYYLRHAMAGKALLGTQAYRYDRLWQSMASTGVVAS